MKFSLPATCFFFLLTFCIHSQEITETNTDLLFKQALEEYKTGNPENSLRLTRQALKLAPEYHDIRILQIRNYWGLENFSAADEDLEYLLKTAPEYPDVNTIAHQRVNRFKDHTEALKFLKALEEAYPQDLSLLVTKARLLLLNGQRKEARKLAMDLISRSGISGAERYSLQIVLNRSISDELGLNYQLVNFSREYSRDDSWHSISSEYQHNFGRTATIGRATYSIRGQQEGMLYELEAYPVFNDRFYAFANVGFSTGELFPDLRGSLSLFYNFAKVFEGEIGGRIQNFNEKSFHTAILGLTLYQGKFYFNAKSFLGPERNDQLVRNYQGNIRYYFTNADNYLFLRVGSGISPDERILSTQTLENPLLEAYYGTLGINFSIGVHHLLQAGAGILREDITSELQGVQFLGSAGYRYRF